MAGTERTIGQLVADATHDLQGIVRGEIALAKAEVTNGASILATPEYGVPDWRTAPPVKRALVDAV